MNKNEIIEYLNVRGISVNEEQYLRLVELKESTLKTNQEFNLTSITDDEEFIEKMILDSALAVAHFDLNNKKFIDLGTGAGFPGLVIKILCPESDMTLLDSTKKKVDHLKSFIFDHHILGTVICERAEEHGSNPINRGTYDVVFARAVAPLNILLELAVPLLKVGGLLVALKGKNADEEIANATRSLKTLKCHLDKIYVDTLPISGEERKIVFIKKDGVTPIKYPRQFSQIKSKPL